MTVSVDIPCWDTQISIREVVINKQPDFIRKEMSKYKPIWYIHNNEMGIPVSYGEDADKPFLLGQTWFFYWNQKTGVTAAVAGLGEESISDQYYIHKKVVNNVLETDINNQV